MFAYAQGEHMRVHGSTDDNYNQIAYKVQRENERERERRGKGEREGLRQQCACVYVCVCGWCRAVAAV